MLKRVFAVLLQEYFITLRSLEIIVDVFFFPLMSLLVFGFSSVYLAGSTNSVQAYYLILGMILWGALQIAQYTVSINALWNIWSRNLSNMFISPLSISEYIGTQMLSGALKAILATFLLTLTAHFAFHFDVWQIGGLNLTLALLNLIMFAWSTGIIILGVIFRYGGRIQALAWGLIFLFQPLCAAFFPVTVLPNWLQFIALTLPPTYVFEAARMALTDRAVNWQYMGASFELNIVYLVVAFWAFSRLFRHSKVSGQFARNE
jgi:ABC-2 type transport system permease protein